MVAFAWCVILSSVMSQELYILGLIGTFAFAVYGSYYAIQQKCDILGIFIAAFLTALGGGTVRDVILGRTPQYFYDTTYIYVIIAAIISTILVYEVFNSISKYALVLDSIGLVTFAFVGANIAYASGMHSIFAIAFFATLTSAGGGMLRDISLNKMPEVMYRDFYASTAIVLGIVYSIFASHMNNVLWANVLIILCLIVRLTVIFFNIHLWNPSKYIFKNTAVQVDNT